MYFDFKSGKDKINYQNETMRHANYFDNFFSFNSLTVDDIYNFLFSNTTEDKKHSKVEISDMEEVLTSSWYSFNFSPELLDNFLKKIDRQRFINFCNTEEKLEFFKTLLKFCLYRALDEDFSFESKLIFDDEIKYTEHMFNLSDSGDMLYFFRGQEDFSWNITPSLIRNLKVAKGHGLYIDINSMYSLYSENNYSNSLKEKYNKTFEKRPVIYARDINYYFLSWMQHAVSYSPLVDFTSDYAVASSFAVRANNPNLFLYNDSAIYILELSKYYKICTDVKEVDKIISSMHISFLKKKIRPGKKIRLQDTNNRKHILDFSTYDKIIDELIPEFIIIDIPTNDRMLRQKGKFVLFYNYVAVKGEMFRSLANKLHLEKHKIFVKDKAPLLQWLDKNKPDIKNSYLMNPYTFFND